MTTLERTVVPVPVPDETPKIDPDRVSEYSDYGYGYWQFGPGMDYEQRLDLMPEGYNGSAIKPKRELLRYFTMADTHVTDEETPAGAVFYGQKLNNGYSGAYVPSSMLFSTQLLDAAVQTVNKLHEESAFNLGIFLGDTVNNHQYNELRWFIDVLDGGYIRPSSGDHAGEFSNLHQMPFEAAGLNEEIPWYVAMGNHDHFWNGVLNPNWEGSLPDGTPVDNQKLQDSHTSDKIIQLGPLNYVLGLSYGALTVGYYMGTMDGSSPYGEIVGSGPAVNFPEPPTVVPDPDRRPLTRKEWIGEFFNTSSLPAGHGFAQSNADTGFACYTIEPKNKQIKIIVLDDTQRDDDPWYLCYGHGSIDQERYNWLVSELQKGQSAGKLMIIAAHVPLILPDATGFHGWWEYAYKSTNDMIATLQEYPNLIMWMSGHAHNNTVTAVPSLDPDRPECGFWQVETASLKNFPQQFRTFDIILNRDNTVSIFATDVDLSVREGSPAEIARRYAIAHLQIWENETNYLPTGSYNVELLKKLSTGFIVKHHR